MNTKKLFAIMLMLLCLCLCACGDSDEPAKDEPVKESISDTTDSAPVEQDSRSNEEESEPAEQTPVDIETDGGVVIVGKINVDDDGWYIQPEQPLNISFRYFDDPSVFTEQVRIKMFDPKEDGIEKALYIGQTVTASGTFSFYRDDFETLYFLPYNIIIGKNAEQSYSSPGLLPPDTTADLYDPSKPLPKYMDPMISGDGYYYNAFMLSKETISFMGNDFADFYVGFVDAFLNYQTEISCPDKNFAEMLSTIIYYEFPMYSALAEPFEFFRHYDEEKSVITIEYKYDEEEFTKIKEEFLTAADKLLADVKVEQSDVEKAKTIYHAISGAMTYDYSALEEIERKESYYAYLYNSGVCVTFANIYNQLLTQVGIETTLAQCDTDDYYGHVWSVVTLEGEQYFCDPTYELPYDKGTGYKFFGMNYADRTANGLGSMGIRCGRYNIYQMDAGMIAENSLNK